MTRRNWLQPVVPFLLVLAISSCDSRTSEPTAIGLQDPAGLRIAPLLQASDPIPGRYIVVLKEGVQNAPAMAERMVPPHRGKLHFTYRSIRGFSATLSREGVDALRQDPAVAFVEEDGVARMSTDQTGAPWNLDRIDQRDRPITGVFTYTRTGAGVSVYILDTGIRPTHSQFGTRASVGADFMGDGGAGVDCQGHGTHVAGSVGGTTYGVAKAAKLVAVRVLGCDGSGSTSGVIAGIDWVTNNAVHPAVANMSLGGGYSAAENAAVAASIASGVVYVVAAGNDDANACNLSPASAPDALTVGASTSADARASFSNWGSCLDIFAPGTSIVSASHSSDLGTSTKQGTSMAAPHVAGVAALYMQGRTATPTVVTRAIMNAATLNRLSGLGDNSPNALLFSPLSASPTVFAVNPSALSFTFIRAAAADAGATEAALETETGSTDGVAASMQASGSGSRKDGTSAAAGTMYIGTTSSILAGNPQLKNVSPVTTSRAWQVSDNRSWLSVSPVSGTLAGGATTALTTSVNSGSLATGSHTGTLTLTDVTSSHLTSIPVTVQVTEATVVTLGVPKTSVSGSQDDKGYYQVTVPSGSKNLKIAISGGTGDADLYVSHAEVPDLNSYDCRPYLNGNNESCTSATPAAGKWYILLHGYTSYSGVTLSATVDVAPAAPSSLVRTIVSATRIDLAWTDNSSDETVFKLQRRVKSSSGTWGAWAALTSKGANVTSYPNTGLTAATTYQYRVQACNGNGCSAYATSTEATTPVLPPVAPASLLGSIISASRIDLRWTDRSSNETSFQLFRRTRNSSGTWGSWALVATRGTNVTTYSNTGLAAGSKHQYRVRACISGTCSAYATGVEIALTAPAAPSGAARTIASATRINLAWTDNSSNESTFKIERRVKSGSIWSTWTQLTTKGANVTSYANTGLTAATTYQYRVRACNGVGCSAYTTASQGTTFGLGPAAPTSLTRTVVSATRINLAWVDNSSDETMFKIERRVYSGGTWGTWTQFTTKGANVTSYANTSLTSATTYQYRVRACNTGGCSGYATSTSATTP